MKKLLVIIAICISITGCPGGKRAPKTRLTFINGNHICFSINKNDILKYFAHAVAQATDVTEMLRQHVDQSGSECHIVGDMSVANFLLK